MNIGGTADNLSYEVARLHGFFYFPVLFLIMPNKEEK